MAKRTRQPKPFPIIEGFGYPLDAETPHAAQAREDEWCPFADKVCEKQVQYGFGYCSVTYAAAADAGTQRTYAVCDHRLDGQPIQTALIDHFGDAAGRAVLVPEVVLTEPRTSFDYVAFLHEEGEISDIAVIEAQAIDIRGGGVGPAWRAWRDGKQALWREYFTAEAKEKNRKDTVAYGVNMANIYKRLGMQVATKCRFLQRIDIPLYVVMQHRPFEYLQKRIAFRPAAEGPWDITFMTFDYEEGGRTPEGQLAFTHRETARTTLEYYLEALTGDDAMAAHDRALFLQRVKRKAGLT